MLSILIPIYQREVLALVRSLLRQAEQTGCDFEIICLDDGSEAVYLEKNAPLKDMKGVIYQNLPQNLGRAAIRNRLADLAQSPYLLFLDCDSLLTSESFVANYIQNAQADKVLCGGTVYQAERPKDPALTLHWHFGREREARSAAQRQIAPHHGFTSNNFLIPKTVFNQIRFDETIREYGHEDTLFGQSLQKEGIEIHHLDNPVLHDGLEPAHIFLSKTEKAIANLHSLNARGVFLNTRLEKARLKLGRIGQGLLAFLFFFLGKMLRKRLIGASQPSLFLLDLYKLGYFCRLGA
jgi:glycosyltransferase involved in cell wall biosynthesis